MKRILIVIIVLGWTGLGPFVVAQTQTAPTSAPATAPEKDGEYDLPEDPPGVVAQVGETKILTEELATILDKIPYRLSPKKRKEIWESSLASMIKNALLYSYLEFNKAPDAPDELAALRGRLVEERDKYNQTASLRLLPEITIFELMERKGLNEQRLTDQARYEKLLATLITNEKLLAFMDKHPDYFNGTKVHLGHILISCSPLAPTEEQKKAVEKLQTIAADIRGGKITFAQAAHEYSQCPSGKTKGLDGTADYGDLGNWTFPQLLVHLGASVGTTAFNSDVGVLTDVVRSNRGFHLIKVFEQTRDDQPRRPESAGIARAAVSSLVENQILNQALDRTPIIIYKAARKVPKPE